MTTESTPMYPVEKSSISSKKIEDRFKYVSSLGRAAERSHENFLMKLRKKRQIKNSRTFTEKPLSQSTTSLDKIEFFSSKNENWQKVQLALTDSLLGKSIKNLSEVLCCIRQLDEQYATNIIVDYYENQILKNTLQKLQRRIANANDIEESWIQFFRKSLPNVILILSSLKTHQEYVERITLYEFKRRLTKVEDLKKKLIKKQESSTDTSVLQHMFLVLQSTKKDDNEITDIDIEFEEIASVLISPLVGYSGIFVEGRLIHKCKNVTIYQKHYDSDSKRQLKKKRMPLSGLFGKSKSLLDITGKF